MDCAAENRKIVRGNRHWPSLNETRANNRALHKEILGFGHVRGARHGQGPAVGCRYHGSVFDASIRIQEQVQPLSRSQLSPFVLLLDRFGTRRILQHTPRLEHFTQLKPKFFFLHIHNRLLPIEHALLVTCASPATRSAMRTLPHVGN